MNRGESELQRDRKQNRGEDHHGRRGIHEAADDQQQDVDQDQNDDRIAGDIQNGLRDHGGDLFDGQDTREGGCGADDGHGGAIGGAGACDGIEELLRREFAIDEHTADKGVDRSDGRSFRRGEDTAVDTAENDDRIDESPLGVPDDGEPLFAGILPAVTFPAHLLAVEVAEQAEADTDENAGQEAGQEHAGDGGRRGDTVDDHRDAGGDDNADTARAGHAGEGETLAVPLFQHGGHDHGADRRDGCRAGSADRGEEHADHDRDDREAACDVSEVGAADVQYSFGDTACGHQLARKDKQGDRHDGEGVGAGDQLLHHEA